MKDPRYTKLAKTLVHHSMKVKPGDKVLVEAFDIPTLRGIGKTAPYFHNNVAETLQDVVELYSDHFLSKFPSLTLPGEKEPDPDGNSIGPPDALTAGQKSDLVAFLKRL